MEKPNYKHKIKEVVRFHEVDLMGVCNNAVYFNYFEDARLKYLQELKLNYKFKEILEGDSFFIMAHNEADYIEPAQLDDELIVYTRINFIKNSSFGFRHIIENVKTKRIICRGGGVFVHINLKTKKSIPLPDEFFEAALDFDSNIEIFKELP